MASIKTISVHNNAELDVALRDLMGELFEGAAEKFTGTSFGEFENYFEGNNRVQLDLLRTSGPLESEIDSHNHAIKISVIGEDGQTVGGSILDFCHIQEDIYGRPGPEESNMDFKTMLREYRKLLHKNVSDDKRAGWLPILKELERIFDGDKSTDVENMTCLLQVKAKFKTIDVSCESQDPRELESVIVHTAFREELVAATPEFRERLKALFGEDTSVQVMYFMYAPKAQ